ncbi:MAG: EAL domain-containing protein [Methylococcales bacterium]|nr:EAL domain-containing protein [Methylococcales bacterium]
MRRRAFHLKWLLEQSFIKKQHGLWVYVLTLFLMGAALFVRLEIAPVSAGLQYLTFFPAVAIAAVIGGYRTGLFATAIGLIFATYIFVPPYYSFSISSFQNSLLSNLVFLFDGTVVSFSIEKMHSYREKHLLELEQIKKSETRFRELFENSPVAYQSLNSQGCYIDVNDRLCALLGYERDELLGRSFGDFFSIDAREIFHKYFQELKCTGTIEAELELRRKDNLLINVIVSGAVQCDYQGNFEKTHCIIHDISERKKIEQTLRIAAAAFETHEAIMITDARANILCVNKAFQQITGYSREEVVGKSPRMLNSGRQDKLFYFAMWRRLLKTGKWDGEIWDRRKNGQIYPKWLTVTALKDNENNITEYIALFSDITERKEVEEEIRNLAFYDTLTHLPNRRFLLDRFKIAISLSERTEKYGAVIFLDMDKFKTLNDTLGHDYGDMMLIEVAERIKHSVRDVDTVARLGGDEFIVLFENLSHDEADASRKVTMIAEKIRASLATPFHLNEHVHYSSPSIGVCLYRGHAVPIDELIKRADIAMYQAKNSGRNTVRFYDPILQQTVENRTTLELELRHAVLNEQLQLYYQIQLDHDYVPLGAEALIRWIHPQRGIISPAQFIPLAEESGLILEIGHWVIEQACSQLAKWKDNELMNHLQLAINVSPHQFKLTNFVEIIDSAIQRHQISPSLLKLELTENIVLGDVADVIAKMHALKALGVSLSLDDFGTGYSSLTYLKLLPIDQIKIDQSFVRDIVSNSSDVVMVNTIIELAKNFELNVIAEGVETEAQLHFLKGHNSVSFQGFFFSKPIPIEQFESLLKSN